MSTFAFQSLPFGRQIAKKERSFRHHLIRPQTIKQKASKGNFIRGEETELDVLCRFCIIWPVLGKHVQK
jgi:hypothetical protein